MRLWNLQGLPAGLQQDEASIGYEAYSLLHYGIDRNGYHWPIYPITWGSGGGSPLMIYLNIITTFLFGSSVWSIRIIPAFLGCCTLALFFYLMYRYLNPISAWVGLFLLSVAPWHIILSRWSLDSNTMPFFQILTVLLLTLGAETKKNRFYVASCILAAVCLYDYGSATVVIPLFLLLSCIHLLRVKALSWKQLLLGFVAFVVTVLPLALFYAINFLDLPEISTSWISVPKLVAEHSSAFVSFDANLPGVLAHNAKKLFVILSVGSATENPWNSLQGYASLYEFMFPLLVLGIIAVIADIRHKHAAIVDVLMLNMFIAACIFAMFITLTVNRLVLTFLPAIYLEAKGICFLGMQKQRFARFMVPLATMIVLIGFFSFSKDYYGGRYNRESSWVFMPGYGEAIQYANQIAEAADSNQKTATPVYSTYTDVAAPFMLTLYYTKYNVHDYIDTVVYREKNVEYQIALSFGRFTYGLPEDDLHSSQYDDSVFVVTRKEIDLVTPADGSYQETDFGDYIVIDRT